MMGYRQIILNRYELGDLLGKGGAGTVYHGIDTHDGQPVAIKQLNPESVASNPEIIERFDREAEALRVLNHPNIVKVLATAAEEDATTNMTIHYLVMEFVPGGSLRDLLDHEGQLSVERTLDIALDLADALTRAHRLKIIHRDIKPANVLLAEDGTPRLTDFGLAHIAYSPRLTRTGVTMGTIDYLSPEVLNEQEPDVRADIWAFGIMLFEMLVEHRPFTGATVASTLTAILTKPVPDLAALLPRVPTALHELIHHMLEKDRQIRISSARLVGARLEAIMEGAEADLKVRDVTDILVQTKLHVPPLRSNLVARSRLIKKLSAGIDRKLTIVSAPAGSGKTTLLSSWVRTTERAKAWVSLDEGDNDLARFLSYFITTLQEAIDDPKFGAAGLSAIQSPQLSSDKQVLTGLINELSATPTLITIVLDDYHLIVSREIHQAMTYFLDHMPTNLHLVIASRSAPPLPLARLRVRHQLNEITSDDLRFTIEESTQFLNQAMGLTFSPEDVADLEASTEGWIAGLQVAALSFQGRSDMGDLVRRFSGSHRHLLDYLADEVLEQQPPTVQTFLLQTSILDRLAASLCEAVVTPNGVSAIDGRAMLERLERSNLFLVPLDEKRQWFRYHHLFAEFLRNRLRETEPDKAPELHARASLWFEKNGMLDDAVNHALAADDFERTADLIEGIVKKTAQRQRLGKTMLRWLQTLPEKFRRTRPLLALAYAWLLLSRGRYDKVEVWLSAVETMLPANASNQLNGLKTDEPGGSVDPTAMLGEVEAIRGLIACYQGDPAEAVKISRRALSLIPKDEFALRGTLAGNIALNLSDAVSSSSDIDFASQLYVEAASAARASGDVLLHALSLNGLAELLTIRGHLYKAEHSYRQALTTLQRRMLLDDGLEERASFEQGIAHLGLSGLAYEWNDLSNADDHLQTGIKLSGRELRDMSSVLILEAWMQLTFGHEQVSLEKMQQAVDAASSSSVTWLATRAAAAQARLWLKLGNVEAAAQWAATSGLTIGDEIGFNREGEYITLARVLLVQRKLVEAQKLLDWLLGVVEKVGLMRSQIRILSVKAIAALVEGSRDTAVSLLGDALRLAEPEGYVRTFIDEGPLMAKLLHERQEEGQMTGYVYDLLAATGDSVRVVPSQVPRYAILQEPLSQRELEVLHLLATDLTGPEIASELFIALSTMRSHTKSIYTKLDVHSRQEAIYRAKELKLI